MKRLLLLSPSNGLGGGIERVGEAILETWPGQAMRLDLLDSDGLGLSSRLKAAYGIRALGETRRYSPDLVLCLHAGLLPVAAAAAALCRAPLALWAHGTEVWYPLRLPERRWIRRAEYLFASSSFTREWLAFRGGITPDRVHVLPLPLAHRLADDARAFSEPASREPVLLTVSRLVPEHRYKGHFDIAECMPHVLAELPQARWVVVGDGPDLPALRARCAELGVMHAVDLVGAVTDDELARLYGAASAFVLPSVALPDISPPAGEGLGLVYVEAGAFGLPSVASSLSGGASDFVRHEETGLCAPPGRAEWLAQAVCRLLDDSDLRRRLGRAARERALKRHTPERFAADLRRVLSLGKAESPSRQRA